MVIKKNNPCSFQILVNKLKESGTAIIPCDTIYGIVGIAPFTEKKIKRIKKIHHNKSFIQLIPSVKWLKLITDLKFPEIFASFWPGPLTLIFPYHTGKNKVAIRIPQDAFLQKLLEKIGAPLFSTSVNKTGYAHLYRIKDIIKNFEKKVDLILDSGDLTDRSPSTIVDLTASPYRLIRQGILKIPPELLK